MIPPGAADLWCTYAAVRTLAWLDRADRTPNHELTAGYARGRRNADGGFAWSKGMPSDAWATFYCASTLADLGQPLPHRDRTARWLRTTWAGDAYAMTPGQAPDVWATHFSTRTAVEICGEDVPDRERLLAWLAALQTRDGGLSWSPEHAAGGEADVRAGYYGVAAWRALCAVRPVPPPWDVAALTGWLGAQQVAGGGFRFGPEVEVACVWATYRAVGALAALGAAPAPSTVDWILARRLAGGAFTRWRGYQVADVWASFCAVGALKLLGGVPAGVADAVEKRVAELACPGGGFTYREPERAADALTVAAALLAPRPGTDAAGLRRWLEGCQLPNEGGIMYMPGRGAEIRCTLWALAAGAFARDPAARRAIGAWLVRLQNPDGGFGFWHGRGSDLVSTAAAVEIDRILNPPGSSTLDSARLRSFATRTATDTLRSGLQAARVLAFAGRPDRAAVTDLLDRHRVPGGGWANHGNRVPDLLSTYEAVVTADRFGLPVDRGHLAAFLDRTGTPAGASWSPLAPSTGDPLAGCLHRLLRGRAERQTVLPALTLS